MVIGYGSAADIDDWMALVKIISPSFPGLETEEALGEHRATVLRFMDERRALCAKDDGKIVGVLLFSKTHNMICCLGVSPEHRRRGIASGLLERALRELDPARDITVTTFREGDEKGIAPRALYERFGFEAEELIEEFGYPVQRFVLKGR